MASYDDDGQEEINLTSNSDDNNDGNDIENQNTNNKDNQAVDYDDDNNNAGQTQIQANNGQQATGGGCSAWCSKLFYWLPLRLLCAFGCLIMIFVPWIESSLLFTDTPFTVSVMFGYIAVFGIIGLLIEAPYCMVCRKCQMRMLFFMRFLKRNWGRGMLYITMAIFTFVEPVSFTFFCGLYMIVLSILMMIFGYLAKKNLNRMYVFMRGDVDDVIIDGNKALIARITKQFDELDMDKDGKIASTELYKFGEQVLGRKLSNAERHTIQLYLDDSCNGFISTEDWVKQFLHSKEVKLL